VQEGQRDLQVGLVGPDEEMEYRPRDTSDGAAIR